MVRDREANCEDSGKHQVCWGEKARPAPLHLNTLRTSESNGVVLQGMEYDTTDIFKISFHFQYKIPQGGKSGRGEGSLLVSIFCGPEKVGGQGMVAHGES